MTKIGILYVKVLSIPHFVFYKIPVRLYQTYTEFLKMAKLAYFSDEYTMYKDEIRKKKYTVFNDLLEWYLRYKEVNDSYFVYGMDRESFEDSDQYMGMNEFKKLRNRSNYNPSVGAEAKYNYLCLIRDKFIFSNYLSSTSIPVVKNWAIFNKETLRWLESGQVYSTEFFFSDYELNLDCFCKPLDGGEGTGAFTLKIENNALYYNGRLMPIKEFKSVINGNFLLQERIIQHSELDKLYKHSINSLRIVTINNRGKINFFAGFFRMGSDGRIVDNYSAGGIIVGVDLNLGVLMDYGIQNTEKPSIIYEHPDTGIPFSGFAIPYFQEVTEILEKAHFWFYGLHSIGWDIAITKSGPVLIEGNDRWGGQIMMSLKKDFKKEFKDICKNRNSDFINL